MTLAPTPRDALRVVASFTRLEALDAFSYPLSMAMQQLAILVPAILYYFIARLIGDETADAAAGGDYYTFVIVGFAVAAVLQAALSGFGGRLQMAQDTGTFETLLVEPVPWPAIPLAMNVWRLLFGAAGAGLLLLIGAVLGAEYRLAGIPGFAGVLLLGAIASSAVGATCASLMVLAKRATPVLTLYGMAASVFAGTAFPIELIPWWLRWVSYLLPHTYVISASREMLMAQPPEPVVSVGSAVAGLAVFNLIGMSLGLLLFSRSLQYARKMGLLSGY